MIFGVYVEFFMMFFHIVVFGIRDYSKSLITKLFSYFSLKTKRDLRKIGSVSFLLLLLFALKSPIYAKTGYGTNIVNQVVATYSNVAFAHFTKYASDTNIVTKCLTTNTNFQWMTSATDFGLISSTLYLPIQVMNSNNFSDSFRIEVMSNTIPGVTAQIYADYNANGIVDGSDKIITNTDPISEGGSAQVLLAVAIPPSSPIGITNRSILRITSSLTDKMFNYYQYATNYTITYAATNSINDVFANDGVKTLRNFDGTDYLDDHNILVSVKLEKAPQNVNSVRLYFDSGKVPDGEFGSNTEDRFIQLYKNGDYWQGVIPETDADMVDGNVIQFVFEVDHVVYKQANNQPWKILIKKRPDQGSGFNIFPTMVNVQNGEKLQMYYHVYKTGPVKILIYDLKGDFITEFDEGVKSPGGYGPVYWDGKNKYGNTVAVGLYFVHIRGKKLSETRKVIILK